MINNYQLLETLIIRTPLLPTDIINGYTFSKKELLKSYKDPAVLEALFIASPSLYHEYVKLAESEIDESLPLKKIESSLLKYLARMTFRCTPFGTFAGFSVGKWGKENSFKLHPSEYEKHTRLDMFYLCSLAREIAANDEVRNQLLYYPNDTIYSIGSELRYVETKFFDFTKKYEISAVGYSPELQELLSKCTKGLSIEQLIHYLVGWGFDLEESKEYVSDLIDTQILVSELEPSITGGDFLDQIINTLIKLKGKVQTSYIKDIVGVLCTARDKIEKLDSKMGINPVDYLTILNDLAIINIPINPKYLFQIDLKKPLNLNENAIDSNIAGSIRKAVSFLNSFLPLNRPHKPNLERFKRAFFSRYETKEIPLLEALDNEFGVGYIPNQEESYPTPLVDDILTASADQQETMFRRNENIEMLKRKLLDCLVSGAYEVDLNDSDIKNPQNDLPLPDTFSAFGSILGKNSEGEWQILLKAVPGYGSATGFFGRLTPSDDGINVFCKELCDIESKLQPDSVIAEIIHLPQSRVGNLVMRTQIRPYEIPFLAKSSSEKEYQIEMKDLFVSIDGEGNIVLRSRRLNKKVLPRVASAHNFWVNALPIYHFLCDLQTQNCKQGLMFDLGIVGMQYPFYPRIKYRNVILSRATWIFSIGEIGFFVEKEPNELSMQIESWRKKWKIPQRVLLIEDDNELFIDFTNKLFIQLFKEEIARRKSITFTEYPFMEHSIIKDNQKRSYSNEFIATFVRKIEKVENQGSILLKKFSKETAVKRKFILGSRWVYYKLYMGVRTSDLVLTEFIRPLAEKLTSTRVIRKWFFVRYYDPDFHIRLRFEIENKNDLHVLADEVFKTFVDLTDKGVVYRVQTDTYEREIERYSDEAIDYVETIFGYQSKLAVDILKITSDSDRQEELVLLILVRSLMDLMNSFELNEEAKRDFIKKSSENYEKEFKTNTNSLKIVRLKFKYFEKHIQELVDEKDYSYIEFSELISSSAFTEYRNYSNDVIKQIRVKIANSNTAINEGSILWSIFHMLANKLVYAKARKHEFLIYQLLNEYHRQNRKK